MSNLSVDFRIHDFEGLVHYGVMLQQLLRITPNSTLKYFEILLKWLKSDSSFCRKAKKGAATKEKQNGYTTDPYRLARYPPTKLRPMTT